MSQKHKQLTNHQPKAQKKLLVVIGMLTLLKLMIIPNIQPILPEFHLGAWLGADGETYIAASRSLSTEGFFSKSQSLLYYAPGYSIFLFILNLFTGKWLLLTTSLIQTLLYSYSVYFFAQQLLKTKLKKICFLFVIIVLINPTLSLATLVIGYESIIASCCLLLLGLFILNSTTKNLTYKPLLILLSATVLGITIWLSPKMIVPGMLFLAIWIFSNKNYRKNLLISVIAIVILLTFQGSMIVRNQIATGNLISQSSLGTLAIMGAGPKASGKYMDGDTGISCDVTGLNASKASDKNLKCAIDWYLQNPASGLALMFKKSVYLWSPWFGPLYGGTMARNPYLIFHPVKESITTQPQLDFVMGIPGKIISWIWIFGSWLLLAIGYRYLFKLGGLEKVIGNVSLLLIVSNWLSVLPVIGDNRYRIPFMPLSLFLQVVGYLGLKKAKNLN